ncbi:hypothetical protein BLNAU_9445 [Blattamonas nauphoetae]|uniref:PUL domain-containing protein n=1 Tax=Blattamonas nauphoetae TaxID=2049346 RepID=A0ABQ9XVT2_9EUKA|nr:hypothetical protein BLNAU_9445 [Blattamonas nauphoetae]
MPHPSLITETDKTLLNSKETLQFLTNPQTAPIPKNLIALITRLKLLWNKSLHGPVIDFIRLFALNERGQGSILRIPGEKDAKGMTPLTPLSARTIVSEYLTLTGTDQSDPTVQENAVLAMCVIGNLCATTNGRSFLLDSSDQCQPTNFIFFLSKVVEMLNHESGMITKPAILLLYNIIVSMTVETREHAFLVGRKGRKFCQLSSCRVEFRRLRGFPT